MEQLIHRAEELTAEILFESLGDQLQNAMVQWRQCPDGHQCGTEFIPIASDKDSCISREVIKFGGVIVRALVGSRWYIPEGSRCFWVTEYERKGYYLFVSPVGETCILEAATDYLNVAPFAKLSRSVIYLMNHRFPLDLKLPFLKQSFHCTTAHAFVKMVKEKMVEKGCDSIKLNEDQLFLQSTGFIYGAILFMQDDALEKMGCVLERIRTRAGKWIPPVHSLLLNLRFRTADTCDNLGIVVYEAPAYYIMKLKTGEEYILCHHHGKIEVVPEIPSFIIDAVVNELISES